MGTTIMVESEFKMFRKRSFCFNISENLKYAWSPK